MALVTQDVNQIFMKSAVSLMNLIDFRTLMSVLVPRAIFWSTVAVCLMHASFSNYSGTCSCQKSAFVDVYHCTSIEATSCLECESLETTRTDSVL